jgi:Fatty acid desaturase
MPPPSDVCYTFATKGALLRDEHGFGAPPFRLQLPNAAPEAPNNWSLFDEYLELCERHRWRMEDVRVQIAGVDPASLTENDRRVLDCAGEVAIVEGNAPSIVVNQLAIMLHDAEYASWSTYQVGEEAKHFHAIRHYCRHVGHSMAPAHQEAEWAARQKGFDAADFQDQYACILINLFGETLNIHLYQVLATNADEPVLKELLLLIARDERRHQQYFVSYFAKRAGEDPRFIERSQVALTRLLKLDAAPERGPQHHQGTGVSSYLAATEKVLRYGYSLDIITRTVKEQWALLGELFGDRLQIDRRQFYARQMARPSAVQAAAANE